MSGRWCVRRACQRLRRLGNGRQRGAARCGRLNDAGGALDKLGALALGLRLRLRRHGRVLLGKGARRGRVGNGGVEPRLKVGLSLLGLTGLALEALELAARLVELPPCLVELLVRLLQLRMRLVQLVLQCGTRLVGRLHVLARLGRLFHLLGEIRLELEELGGALLEHRRLLLHQRRIACRLAVVLRAARRLGLLGAALGDLQLPRQLLALSPLGLECGLELAHLAGHLIAALPLRLHRRRLLRQPLRHRLELALRLALLAVGQLGRLARRLDLVLRLGEVGLGGGGTGLADSVGVLERHAQPARRLAQHVHRVLVHQLQLLLLDLFDLLDVLDQLLGVRLLGLGVLVVGVVVGTLEQLVQVALAALDQVVALRHVHVRALEEGHPHQRLLLERAGHQSDAVLEPHQVGSAGAAVVAVAVVPVLEVAQQRADPVRDLGERFRALRLSERPGLHLLLLIALSLGSGVGFLGSDGEDGAGLVLGDGHERRPRRLRDGRRLPLGSFNGGFFCCCCCYSCAAVRCDRHGRHAGSCAF